MQPRPHPPKGQGARSLRADAQRNYDLLVAAADAAFTERGAEASLEDIARRAGVGIGTLYRHFPTREALLAQVVNHNLEGVIRRADEFAASSPPTAALTAWLEALIAYLMAYNGLAKALAASLATEGSELNCSCERIVAVGDRLLASAQRAGELRPDAQFKDLMLGAHAAAWAAEETRDPAAAGRLLTMMIDGIRLAPSQAPTRASPHRRSPAAKPRPAARRG